MYTEYCEKCCIIYDNLKLVAGLHQSQKCARHCNQSLPVTFVWYKKKRTQMFEAH